MVDVSNVQVVTITTSTYTHYGAVPAVVTSSPYTSTHGKPQNFNQGMN